MVLSSLLSSLWLQCLHNTTNDSHKWNFFYSIETVLALVVQKVLNQCVYYEMRHVLYFEIIPVLLLFDMNNCIHIYTYLY